MKIYREWIFIFKKSKVQVEKKIKEVGLELKIIYLSSLFKVIKRFFFPHIQHF